MYKLLLILNILTFTSDTVPSDPGTYPVKIEYKDNGVEESKIIQLSVITTSTEVYEELAIDAHDFTVGESVNLSQELIIRLSKAKAWNLTTGENYDIERTEVMKISDEQYEVNLYSFKGIHKTINVFVETDYYSTLNLNEEVGEGITYNTLYEKYKVQLIILVIFLMLTLVVGVALITSYNMMINKTTSDLNSSKDSVKKS